MHDAGPQLAADAAQVGDVMQQRVDQRARRVAGAGVHDHARRLVDDDDIRVLVQDLERRRLGLDGGRRRRRGVSTTMRSPSRTARLGFASRAATAHVPVGDQLLDLRSRMVGEDGDEEAVEPLSLGLDVAP